MAFICFHSHFAFLQFHFHHSVRQHFRLFSITRMIQLNMLMKYLKMTLCVYMNECVRFYLFAKMKGMQTRKKGRARENKNVPYFLNK